MRAYCRKVFNYIDDKIYDVLNNKFLQILELTIFSFIPNMWSFLERCPDSKKYLVVYFLFVFSYVNIIVMLIALVPFRVIGRWIYRLYFSFTFILFLLQCYSLYMYNTMINMGIIEPVLETNFHESIEYIISYIDIFKLAILAIVSVVVIWVSKIKFKLKCDKMRFKGRYWAICFLLSTEILSLFFHYYVPTFGGVLADRVMIIGFYDSLKESLSDSSHCQDYSKRLANDVQVVDNKSSIPYIIFILGESTTKYHMHLYGYYLPDTPNLDKLYKEHQIVKFDNIISPHCHTIAVLKELFTFHDYESPKKWYEYNNLIDVMNAAGYKTYWLSNQESSGIYGNIAAAYASHADYHKFTKLRNSKDGNIDFDGALLPLIDKTLKTNGNKNFYVIHLMGCHGKYMDRYPEKFSIFKASQIKGDYTEKQKKVIANYDNAIYYNDYIVSQIIKTFSPYDAIIIYLPDHGESVYDDNLDLAGHQENIVNKYMVGIPMLVWASQKFKENYPQKWQAIEKAYNRPYMTDDMINTVLDIADIKTREYNPQKSIINSKFDFGRKRMIGDKNYDLGQIK